MYYFEKGKLNLKFMRMYGALACTEHDETFQVTTTVFLHD